MFLIIQCTSDVTKRSADYVKGEQQAKTYCTSCHQYVPPELLDKASWVSVLNSMKHEMNQSGFEIPYKEWLTIQQFYRNQSPIFLSSSTKEKPARTTQFDAAEVFTSFNGHISLLSSEEQYLYMGNMNGEVQIDSAGFTIIKETINNIVPIGITKLDDSFLLLNAGNLNPSNEPNGSLIQLKPNGKEEVISNLIRPVHLTSSNSAAHSNQLLAISSFGSVLDTINTGGLFVYQHTNGSFTQQWSYPSPGATKSIFKDFDHDGDEDIISLFSQGNERIIYFENKTAFNYKEHILVNHSPVWGTNDFIFTDIDQDDVEELIVSTGDNGDASAIFKPYHGIRIYSKNKSNDFVEEVFIPLDGVSKLINVDADNDQDQDLIALCMYPNLFQYPWQTIVYLENKGSMNFELKYLEETSSNQWVLATMYDNNNDDKSDLLVGANQLIQYQFPPALKKNWRKQQTTIATFNATKN